MLTHKKDEASGLVLRLNFAWDLLLDGEREWRPYVHFYLSTNLSSQVHEIDLGDSAAGKQRLVLNFRRTTALDECAMQRLLGEGTLNIDFYVYTLNNYKEEVSNPIGGVMVPLYELVKQLSEGDLRKSVDLFMVHDDDMRNKGHVVLGAQRLADGSSGVNTPIPFVVLNGHVATAHDVQKLSLKALIERNAKMQHICARYIEATEEIYTAVEPTIASVSNINSALWVSRAGVFPPIAYVLDVVRPVVSEAFFQNCLDIVLRRAVLSRHEFVRLDIEGGRAHDINRVGSIAGQFLCCYITHTT